MSRSEKDNPWLKAFGIESSPAYTGECGCKYCCTGIKRAIKRQEHKAERRAGHREINRQILADLHPTSLKNAGSMTYGQDTAD